jgi:mono/diheme cytochrome c family protein
MRFAIHKTNATRAAHLVWCGAALLLIAADVRGEERYDSHAATSGKTTYARYCGACHGATGLADGPLARDLSVAVPNLTTLAARNQGTFPYDRVVSIITHGENRRGHGTSDMPAWGDAFKKSEGIGAPTVEAAIRNVAHYLWSLQGEPGK